MYGKLLNLSIEELEVEIEDLDLEIERLKKELIDILRLKTDLQLKEKSIEQQIIEKRVLIKLYSDSIRDKQKTE